MKKNSIKAIIRLSISIVLIFLILNIIDLDVAYSELKSSNPYYLILSILLLSLPLAVKAIRWSKIVEAFGKNIGFRTSFRYTMISLAYANVTPSRIGEFVRVKFLRDKTGLSYGNSFLTMVFEKIFDALTLVLLVLVGLSFFPNLFPWSWLIPYILAIYIIILIIVVFAQGKALEGMFKIIKNITKKKIEKTEFSGTFYTKIGYFSLCLWLSLILQSYFIAKAVGIDVNLLAIMALVPLMALSSTLPISIGGIGVREIVAIYSLSIIGITQEKSVVFSLLYTLITFVLPALIGSFMNIKSERSTKD